MPSGAGRITRLTPLIRPTPPRASAPLTTRAPPHAENPREHQRVRRRLRDGGRGTDGQIDRLVEDVIDEFDADDETGDVQPMEPDEIIEAVRNGEAREVLAAANETMAAQLKEETDKLLDSVLYTTSMNMKNGVHMSDF